MGEASSGPALRIGGVTLDTARGCLRGADGAEIALAPKPFDLLVMLARNPGRTLSKDALLDAIWHGVNVTEDSLVQAVRTARRAIGDEAGQVLRSVPRRGYLLETTADPAPPPADSAPAPSPAMAPLDRPALAVLPFANLSSDAEQEYFSDGIADELITQLSRARWFYVIARNSSFTYKGRAVDPRQVGRDLGVRYVLEGSVRRAAGRVRIACQLIDAETGHQLWAERFDGTLDDIFELQDRVAEAVAGAIEPSLQHAEIRRAQAKPTGSLSAYDLLLQGLYWQRTLTREGNEKALRLLRAAVQLDPEFALGKAQLARMTAFMTVNSWADDAIQEEGARYAREAVASGRDDPLALALAAHALAVYGADHSTARAAAARAQLLNPNSAVVAACAGWVYNFNSEPRVALEAFQRALRLSPLDPTIEVTHVGLSSVHVALGDYASALEWAERAVQVAPNHSPGHRYVIIANWLLGREEEARAAAARMLALFPTARVQIRQYRDTAFREKLIGALVAAGIPA
ncbi:winged helix-turn-helix domain-containing protein [Neoroseomonas oryzicola]|uniref:CadC-family transcriptional regulator n=1 Tax=Neoroseomonas oryzicola TaxID=535904 RepID=A0A9X9WEF3_9PROT|nr:winged helix-turn-helix domain-containing protein [Neoroseomonas oryzicola]MBR0658713.1 CadC-family transcriptional regulator [Neoroseomonas oryzicola]NKE17851.1 CadC-family transcriptional regulator [Neoroseomonas oryzicola]